jgi:hypothetical protein
VTPSTATYNQAELNAVAKVKCLKTTLYYTRYFFKQQFNRKFVVNEHHEIICRALDLVYAGYLLRLKVCIAPRYGKTEIAVKSFISKGIAHNPASRYIHLSYADDLALDNSESIKDLVESEPYRNLFGEVQIKRDAKSKAKWYTDRKGGVLARAAGGQVTGFGAGEVDTEDDWEIQVQGNDTLPDAVLHDYIYNGIKHPDIDLSIERLAKFGGAIIVDDPIKPEDADQETIREKINSRFDSTIRNRVNSRNTPIIIIMQRLHPRDLCGYLERSDEQDEWLTISMPCIKEDGTALWPFKHTIEELRAMEKANDIVFQRQYMQNPKPKAGLLFPIDDLHFYDPEEVDLTDPDFKYLAADPSGDGGDDFSAIDSRLIGNRIYIPNILYNTLGTDHNEAATVDMILSGNIQYVGIEGIMGWAEVVTRIREELERKKYEGEVRLLRPRTGKHARITTRASFIRNHFYFRKDYEQFPQYAKFMRNLTSYLRIQEAGAKNKHDDAPDNCEMVAGYYQKEMGHLWPTG